MDVPKELKAFQKEFGRLNYKYDTADVFCDFVDLMLTTFKYNGDKELGDRLKKKYNQDYEQLCICVREMFLTYNKELGKKEWFDGLGLFYEEITSKYKSSRLGQFFTPQPVCDLMASITSYNTATIDKKTVGMVVGDPCCGSGRMLLAFNAIKPHNHHYATDMDTICVKMTAINMCLHAIEGQVVCADALMYGDSWRFGYEINATLKFGLPSIENITQDKCFQSNVTVKISEDIRAEKEAEKASKLEKIFENTIQITTAKPSESIQLTLF